MDRLRPRVMVVGVMVVLAMLAVCASLAQAQTATTPPATGGVIGGVTSGPFPVTGASPPGAMPPREPRVPVTGTGRISGTITAAETGRPLRRAVVRLTGGPDIGMRTGSTDADGRYEFSELPAGRYTVTASRTGYVQMGYGQKQPRTPGLPVAVQDGATTVRVNVSLPTAGVITGRVVDEYGEPLADVLVSAMRRQFMGGERRFVPSGGQATTNDIGEFRLHSLAPGDYFVSATLRASFGPNNTDRSGYATTFYPAASSPEMAQPVVVHPSETVSNIVLTLSPTRLNRVTGIVIDADGRQVQGGAVIAMPRNGVTFSNGNGIIRPDGSFEINGLADGDYLLRAMLGPMPIGPAAQGGPPLQASATVTVAGSDLSNVIVRPVRAIVLSGSVTGEPATLAAIRPGAMQLTAARLAANEVMGPQPGPARLRDDFTFELPVYPGRITLRAIGLNGTLIESVRWHGTDVTRGFDLGEGDDASDFEVVLTNQSAKLAVTAVDAKGEPVAAGDVVIFTTDEAWWGSSFPGHGSSGRTDENGRFQSLPLLPGSYYVVAVTGLETFQAGDPEFLESIRARAQRVTLANGDVANTQTRALER